MKKRILALLLVLCTVLVSVPAFVLPAAAAGSDYEYSTSFNSSKYPVGGVYPDAAWGVYQYPVTGGVANFGTADGGLVNQKSYYGELTQMVCGPAGTLGWNDRVHFTLQAGSYGFGAFNYKDQIAVSQKAAAAVRYTVEKAGTVDINIDRLANISTQSNGTFVYSVMVNGLEKWSTTVEMANGVVKGDIVTDTTPDQLKNITVAVGDIIEFTILGSALNGDKTCWQGSGNVFQATVNFRAAVELPVTSFNSYTNMPTFDGTAIIPTGGWQPMGYLKKNGYDDPGKAYKLDINANQIISGGVNANFDEWPGAPINGWAQKCSMTVTPPAINNYWKVPGQLNVTDEASAGVRYTITEAGYINIKLDQVGNLSTAGDKIGLQNFRYGVFHNGVMIWPVAGGTLSETDALTENKVNVLVATDLKVKEGDVLDFICEAQVEAHQWTGSANVIFPTIAYTVLGLNVAHTSSFNNVVNMPIVSDTVVSGKGGWMPMAYTKVNGYADPSKASPMNTLMHSAVIAGKAIAAASDWPGGTIVGWRNKASIVIDNTGANGNFFNTRGQINVTTEQSGGMRYTAEKTGKVDIIIDKLINTALSSGESAGIEAFRYGIFHNGTMIWPVAGGTLSETVPLTAAGLANVEAVIDLDVVIGDAIDFIIEAQGVDGSESINNYSGAGHVFFATINYSYVNPNVAIFNGSTNLPKFDADGKVVYSGNFFPMSYVKGDDGFDYSNEDLIIPMDGRSPIMPTSSPYGAVSSVDLRWGGTARSLMVLESFNVNFFKDIGQINVTGKMSGGIRYVTEETGTLRIDLSRVGNTAPKAAGLDKFSYFVYVNGEKVWGMTGSEIKAALGGAATGTLTNVPVAADIDVVLGDTIDFIVEGATIGEADPWQGAGNIMFPIITYTKVIPKPTTSANVALGSNFALNVKVNLPEEALETMADFGLLVNGEEFPLIKESDTLYSAHNVLKAYVQDLESDTVTFQPYYITDEGMTIWGNEVTTNIVDVLQAYYNGEDEDVKNIAIATLNYVAEAQRYFDPLLGEDDLANAILAEDERDLGDFDVVAPSETVIIANPNGATVDFTGVSMILNNALALKFHIALPEDADIEEYALAAIDPMTLMAGLDAIAGIPAGAMVNPLKYTEEDGDAVAYFGTTFENMDRMYAFLVINAEGEVVSDIVLYNPLTYATTMVGDIEVGFVCKSLIALNEAIDVYTGAIANR